ncbi:MAG: transcriptional repressor NrdR [Lachnospiraceae bacterium]|nr:transcriptional repressor NrdR [Lachnospiraceae bacterium]
MRCVYCNHTDSRVVDSRPTEDGWAIRRRRECIACGRRFTTYEKVETPSILVVKKDNRRESFNPEKIRAGIIKACEKRQVDAATIDKIVSEIEKQVYNNLEGEVSSAYIGELVMDKLKDLDQVAYVRFASVHRQFKDINTLMEEMQRLLGDQSHQ